MLSLDIVLDALAFIFRRCTRFANVRRVCCARLSAATRIDCPFCPFVRHPNEETRDTDKLAIVNTIPLSPAQCFYQENNEENEAQGDLFGRKHMTYFRLVWTQPHSSEGGIRYNFPHHATPHHFVAATRQSPSCNYRSDFLKSHPIA